MEGRQIDVNSMMSLFIQEVRSVNTDLPIIVQSVYWSDPQWWSLLGVQFLSDHVEVAEEMGWHYCLWNYRSDSQDPLVLTFDYEKWDSSYWDEILSWF